MARPDNNKLDDLQPSIFSPAAPNKQCSVETGARLTTAVTANIFIHFTGGLGWLRDAVICGREPVVSDRYLVCVLVL